MRLFLYLFYFLLTVLIVIFATQNMESVLIYLVFSPPLELPLIVVVGVSFFIGYAFCLFNVILRATRGRSVKKPTTGGE